MGAATLKQSFSHAVKLTQRARVENPTSQAGFSRGANSFDRRPLESDKPSWVQWRSQLTNSFDRRPLVPRPSRRFSFDSQEDDDDPLLRSGTTAPTIVLSGKGSARRNVAE